MQYKLAAAALCLQGALASPNNHRRHGHARREAMQYDNPNWTATVDWNAICANGACAPGASTAAPASPSAAAPAVNEAAAVVSSVTSQVTSAAAQYAAPSSGSSSAAAPSSSSSSNTGSTAHSGSFSIAGFGASSGPGSGSGTYLNIGEFGSPPGSNIIQVQDASSYQFTNTFTNNMGSPRTLWIWNKSGIQNGQTLPNVGQYLTPAVQTTVPAGSSVSYAFMNNTQAVACDVTGSENNKNNGLPNCAWLEMNMVDPAMSGVDMSMIQLNGGTPCAVSVSYQGKTITSCSQKSFNSDQDSDSNSAGLGGNGAQVNLQTTFG